MTKTTFKITCVVVFCVLIGHLDVVAVDVAMPFKYRNTQNGETIEGTQIFLGAGYTTAGTYCAANHRDPDGNKYGHAHLPHYFPFVPTGSSDQVTAGKSDWAWDAHYSGYTRVSGSTFQKNCFAHTSGAPEVTFYDGWTQFTEASSQCENTSNAKSYGDGGHCIAITDVYTFPESTDCVISGTSEKNASGGVYTHGWLPLGQVANHAVRKKK